MNNEEGVLALELLKDQLAELSKWSAYHNDTILINLVDIEVAVANIEARMLNQIEKEEHEELKETFQSVPYENGEY